jgi:hypothetical protein
MTKFAELKILDLHDCAGLTDAGLKEIASAPQLASISIGGKTRITDAGLLELTEMKTLKFVNVRWCDGVSESGAATLRKAIPGLTVWHE